MAAQGITRRKFLRLAAAGSALVCAGGPLALARAAEDPFTLALRGQELIAAGRYGQAVAALEEAVAADPSSDWAWGLLGRAHYMGGNMAQARDAFRNAVRLNPEDAYSRMMMGIINQRPVNRTEPAAPADPEMARLEARAREEEARFRSRLTESGGLEYQVRRVVIDPGHGGFDPGAVGAAGLKEKDVNLDIARRLHERLAREGRVASYLTRRSDYYVPLGERSVVANQYRADLFISIHINAAENRAAKGTETYYCAEKASSKEAARVAEYENSVLRFDEGAVKKRGYVDVEDILFQFERKSYWAESGRFAGAFQGRMEDRIPLRSRGVHSANFAVLRRARMPAILVECGFISNADEEARLARPEFRQEIAEAVARGLS